VQGNLTRDRLPEVIQSLGRERESGMLQVSRDDVSKRIYFGRGSMVFARSTLHSDRLGEMLVRRGELTRSNLALASNKMRARREKLGATLVSLGLMSQHQMRSRLQDQVRGIIHSLFTWKEGDFRFQPESSVPGTDVPLDLPTVPIILEGTRLTAPEVVHAALGDMERVVTNTKDPRVVAHYANLTPEEGFVLSRIDGTATLANIVSMSPLAEEETLRCLYGLLSSGFLDLGKKSKEVAPSTPKRRDPIEIFHRPMTPSPARPRRERNPSPPAPSREDGLVHETIDEKHRALSTGTYYDWLEVNRTADTKEIKKAFATLIKKYHPDRHRPEVARAVGGKLEAILTKATQAYETLCDAQSRRRYDNSLRTEAPKGEVAATSNVPPKPEAKPRTPSENMAERYYREAKKYFTQRDYHEVVKLMEEAVGIDGSKVRYHCLLAQALSHNPKWRRTAEEHFKKALALEPFDTESLVGLAELYEAVGLARRAQALYAEAVEIDPGSAILRMKLTALE
jgi:curved DNA-binding protein CbpA